jgi:hypothetical protein
MCSLLRGCLINTSGLPPRPAYILPSRPMTVSSSERWGLSRLRVSEKTGLLQDASFFIWLATLNRCWAAYNLARKGLDHPERCPFCDQKETAHLLVGCVFAREVWFRVLSKVGMQCRAPSTNDEVFQEWWKSTEHVTSKCKKKVFNSLVMLVAWWLWKHRNTCVFDEASPSTSRILQAIEEDAKLWCMVGPVGLRAVWA